MSGIRNDVIGDSSDCELPSSDKDEVIQFAGRTVVQNYIGSSSSQSLLLPMVAMRVRDAIDA